MKKLALPIRFGIAISGCLIAYFLVLALFNLHTNPLYSLFNSVITGFGIYEAIKAYKLRQEEQFNYINGFKIGLIAGTVATAVFTVFFAFYSTELNPSFYTDTMAKLSMDSSVGLVIFAVGMLGIATTVIITLTLMQLFKPSNNLA